VSNSMRPSFFERLESAIKALVSDIEALVFGIEALPAAMKKLLFWLVMTITAVLILPTILTLGLRRYFLRIWSKQSRVQPPSPPTPP
jgi:hypothetical protein